MSAKNSEELKEQFAFTPQRHTSMCVTFLIKLCHTVTPSALGTAASQSILDLKSHVEANKQIRSDG